MLRTPYVRQPQIFNSWRVLNLTDTVTVFSLTSRKMINWESSLGFIFALDWIIEVNLGYALVRLERQGAYIRQLSPFSVYIAKRFTSAQLGQKPFFFTLHIYYIIFLKFCQWKFG